MKYKKLLVVLSCIIGVVVLCTILSFTLFKCSSVQLNFKNETTIYASQENKNAVIRSGGFSYNTPIFGINKNKIINDLEKNNSYLKVINIETVFPNKLVVHCAERERLFCIKNDNLYYYCDEDLKVLEDPSSYKLELNDNITMLENVYISNKDANKGEFLKLLTSQPIIKNIATAFAYNNRNISEIKGMFKSVKLVLGEDYYTCLNEAHLIFTTKDNFKVKICLARCNLIEKINLMLALIPKCANYYSTHMLIIELNPNNPTQKPYLHGEIITNQ